MTTLERLSRWKRDGVLTESQHDSIAAIVGKDRFSLFLELNALLYLGVLAVAAGLAWTVRTSFADFGDVAIVLTLTGLLGACFFYCFSRALPYSPDVVESPTLGFDYVLYLGCLVLGIELAYLESRFQLLQGAWHYHVLFSAAVFYVLAYRFDNRFVLSLAHSTLATWFGIKLWGLGWYSPGSLRMGAVIYGVLVSAASAALYRAGIKRHFLETSLHVSANALLLAVLSGTFDRSVRSTYLVGLLALSASSVALGIRHRRFAFVGYGVVYAYIGVSVTVVDDLPSATSALAYVVASAVAVVVLLVYLARTFGREE